MYLRFRQKEGWKIRGACAMFPYGKWKDEIVFGMPCKAGIGYYTYNPTTGVCSPQPVATTVGIPSSLLVFE